MNRFSRRVLLHGGKRLDLFRSDLFRLYAWAAESQQVSRRFVQRGTMEMINDE